MSLGLKDFSKSLTDAGHDVKETDPEDVDLFLGERCLRMTKELAPYVGVVLKEAQRGRYDKAGKAKREGSSGV